MHGAPIIFCHYGDSDYLRYTLACVRRTNPNKRIILLGDEDNGWLGKHIEHHLFKNYSSGAEIETFVNVYKLIQGAKHGHERSGRDWVNFVFKRWFYVYNFVKAQGIAGFWHFDSDTMIVEALEKLEARYSDYDCTEQCDGSCMNGYIASPDVVRRYLQKINELFQRTGYLEEQAREFKTSNPNYAFTEMRAYEVFRSEERIKSIRLSHVADNSMFDDTVFLAQGMESERLRSGKFIKKVYLHHDGLFICRDRLTAKTVRVNALNLSWLPEHTFKIVLQHARFHSEEATRTLPLEPAGKTLANRIDSSLTRVFLNVSAKIRNRIFGRHHIAK